MLLNFISPKQYKHTSKFSKSYQPKHLIAKKQANKAQTNNAVVTAKRTFLEAISVCASDAMRVSEFRQCAGVNAGQRRCQFVVQEMCTLCVGASWAQAIANVQKK